ncbi:hypothetical protein AHAS_Ahas16G0263400 [Arachis hypogaea]
MMAVEGATRIEEDGGDDKYEAIGRGVGHSDVVHPRPEGSNAVSQVCRRWDELDSLTRKHVTIALCYTTSLDRLRRRFPHLESLKLKGKP